MCRLTAYLGPPAVPADLVTRPNRSMITQSYAARERQQGIGYLNGDGFGLGWYPQDIPDSHPDRLPGEPCAFTDQGPAWNNRNLAHLARSIISPLVFVHIRAATPGLAVCSCSCHPFTYGRMMWMHNGCIGNFRDVRRELLASLGDRAHSFAVDKGASDSALCFAIFLDEIADPFAILELNEMRRAVESVIHRIEAACIKQKCTVTNLLNFVVSDGHSIIATRYIWRPSPDNHDKAATMYFGSGTGYECRNPETGEYRMVHKDRRERLAVITSEPLTTDQTDWVSVPENHILIVSHDVHMLLSEIGPPMETNRCLVESLKCLRFEQLTRDMLPAPSANFEESMVGDTVFEDPCVHTMFGHEDTILSLASSDGLLFSGSQDATIRAWDIEHFHCAHVLKGHTGSIFSLAVHDGVLLSASSDNTVRRWDVKETFECLTIVQFYGMGDILSMSIVGSRLFLGFQDTKIRCLSLECESWKGASSTPHIVECKSLAQELEGCKCVSELGSASELRRAEMHCGYIYALVWCDPYLISGSGDGFVKLWNPDTGECVSTLRGHRGSVLAVACTPDRKTLITGSRDCTLRVWDVETKCHKRSLTAHTSEVLSIVISKTGFIYTASADGEINVWSSVNFQLLQRLRGQEGAIQAMITFAGHVVAGGSKHCLFMWDAVEDSALSRSNSSIFAPGAFEMSSADMQMTLRAFVGIASVSGVEKYREQCWEAAKFVSARLKELGCDQVILEATGENTNPIVIGSLIIDPALPTVLVYGHYDVQPVAPSNWNTPPWQLTAIDEYLYGRGATDDKGPIVATLHAVHELRLSEQLEVNIVFTYEGEEECNSHGYKDTISRLMEDEQFAFLSDVSTILVSNNYWIDETRPCLTYGMRGVLEFHISISGGSKNLHSGVDGGAVFEPLTELTTILSTLTDGHGNIKISGFYDDVSAPTEPELKMLDNVQYDVEEYRKSLGTEKLCINSAREILMARWRNPTLSIVSIDSSNMASLYSVIPCRAAAKVSVRIVPYQRPEKIIECVRFHLNHEFSKLRSPNALSVEVLRSGDWWFGDAESKVFKAAAKAINKVWHQPPILVREGGTMPITSFLEQKLGASALHLPLGQASDGAHLANERISVKNLVNGKNVIKYLLRELASPSACDSDDTEANGGSDDE
eukprot:m.130709 g.130709  ORF g.130709 m.130709 type:complete len:1157 (-) comp9793_c1_seq2:1936-5406(-)